MLYRGLRPKTKVFYSRFRRNVWHPGWGKCGPKMVSLNRPGHAVSPFGGRPFGAGIWWFWCEIVPKPGQNLNVIDPNLWCYRGFRPKTRVFYSGFRRNVWHRADATGGLKSAPVDLSGHAVSLLRCSVFWASFCSPGATTWAITMVESLWWRSYHDLRFLLSIQAQRLTSGGCHGGSEKPSCGPLWPCCFAAAVLCLLGVFL